MFGLLRKLRRKIAPLPIDFQIEQYCHWRSIRYPHSANRHRETLDLFSRFSKIKNVHEVEKNHVEAFIDQYSGYYLRSSSIHVLRQFFAFCKKSGWVGIELAPLPENGKLGHMEKTHPLLDLENVIRVKRLRDRIMENGRPMTYRAIASYLSRKDKKTYDVHSVYRWANYRLPAGYTLSPD